MKAKKAGRKKIRTQREALRGERQEESPAGNLSLDTLSGYELIEALRGSCKGKTSLVAAREREHKRDERAKARKLQDIGRDYVRSSKTGA